MSINTRPVMETVEAATPAHKSWTAPVVTIHDVADLTMAGTTNTNDHAGGTS